MDGIKGYATFTKIELINKGWSSDQKYYIETDDGKELLIRLSEASSYDRKKFEFEAMQEVMALGLPMSQPLDFGLCDQGRLVYSLFTWCPGEEAQEGVPKLTEMEQYTLGLKAGKYLKTIHSIPAPRGQGDWEERFSRKTRKKIEAYLACAVTFPGDEHIIRYLADHEHLLFDRPQCFQHGDYHVGNMVITNDKSLSIIDFNRCDYGDPWEEFNRIVFSAKASPHFATGQLHGYFGGEPHMEFFRLLAFYISSNTISAIPWAIPFGEPDVANMKKQAREVLAWYKNMTNPVPNWYFGCFPNSTL